MRSIRQGTRDVSTILDVVCQALCMHMQGCKFLLLGDARAFFVAYRLITDAGLRAFQLDRDGALARGGNQARASGYNSDKLIGWRDGSNG